MGDVVPLPLPASPRQGGRDVVVSACWCGSVRWRAVVEISGGVVVDVEPLLVCDGCGSAHVLRRDG